MANYTNNFQLIFLNQNQLAKDIVINQNICVIDSIMQIKAINYTPTPPSNPADGDVYIIAEQAAGMWLGKEQKIAVFQNNSWTFLSPKPQSVCWCLYRYGTLFYNGYYWIPAGDLPRIGDYKISAQTTDHDNWLVCNGKAIQRSKYNQLFSLIGVSFGVGDGSTTFNLPNVLKNSYLQNTFIFTGLV